MSDLDRIARLRIVLVDTNPAVCRRVEVPITATVRALHDAIQATMPWDDAHLYEFQISEERFGSAVLDGDLQMRDAKNARFLADGVSAFNYLYDFGDNWQHAVTVEAVCDVGAGLEYPRFVDGAGRAPPENIGGAIGLAEFVRVMARPKSREHKRMVEWYGGLFDPAEVDTATIEAKLGLLTRRRALGKAAG